MDIHYNNLKHLLDKVFDKDQYLKRFKVYSPQTLFEHSFEEIVQSMKEKRCLLCGNKLKFPLKGKYAMCRSKKHGKPYLVLKDKLNKYV